MAKMMWLERRRRLVQWQNKQPFKPLHLAVPFLLVGCLLLPLILYSFVVERLVIRAPGWLPITRSDLEISYYLFGGYEQEHYATFVTILFAISLLLGVGGGYALLRRFVPDMASGRPIPNKGLWIRAMADLFLAYPPAVASTSALAWAAGVRETVGGSMLGLASLLAFIVYSGYALGSGGLKSVVGIWWHLALKPVRSDTEHST